MSIELARRLLGSGAPVGCVEAALLAEVDNDEPFVTALLGRYPELTAFVERELERTGVPEIHVVRASTELCAALPPALCERLLAVPVFRDPESGRVDVAAVDVLDPHIAAEFSYQLRARVRVLRASLAAVRAALAGLEASREAAASVRGKDSARGSNGPARPSAQPVPSPSEPPIPLVRPGSPSRSLPARGSGEEPVLNLTRAKPSMASPFAFTAPLEQALDDVARARSADEVAEALARGLEPAEALVLAVRPSGFEARAASSALPAESRAYSLPSGKSSVFDGAIASGYYLGPLPGTLVHAELRSLISPGPPNEVYVAPVLVATRPVLVVFLSKMGPALEATRRADRLIAGAAEALSRIVRERKQRQS